MTWVKGVCDVCRLTLEDESVKDVRYCQTCSAWICRDCEFSSRRIVAFAKSRGLTVEEFRRKMQGT